MGIESTHSYLQCDALPIELPSPWEQGGGEEGYTSASFGAHYIGLIFLLNTPFVDDDAVTCGWDFSWDLYKQDLVLLLMTPC